MILQLVILTAAASTSIARTNNLNLPAAQVVVSASGIQMPHIIYGAAMKGQRTADLVYDAVKLGYRGVDTAPHRAYNEAGVGVALDRLFADHIVTREQLFVQTKFTAASQRDQTIPFNGNAPLADQVRQSLQTSLKNLRITYLDSIVLHFPQPTHEQTMEVYRTFESFVDAGTVLQIGVSNVYDRKELERIWTEARIKPAVVQNSFGPRTGFDRDLRAFCRDKSIGYQAFSAMRWNPSVIGSAAVSSIAAKYGKTKEQAFIRFLIQSDIVPLMGASSSAHMREDFDVLTFQLTPDEVATIAKLLV